MTLIGAPDVTALSICFIPIVENTSVFPLPALMEYLPSASVIVPVSLSLTLTVTPGKGSFVVASVTTPFTSMSWAASGILAMQRNKNSKK